MRRVVARNPGDPGPGACNRVACPRPPAVVPVSPASRHARPQQARAAGPSEVPRLLWIIIGVLLLFWLLGVATNVAGALIHILLAVAVVVLVLQLLQGRRSA